VIKFALVPFVALVALPLAAQSGTGQGGGGGGVMDRDPNGYTKQGRYADAIRDRKAFDQANKQLSTNKFKEALAAYKPGAGPELLITWGEFVTGGGVQFIAMEFAAGANSYFKPKTKVTLFGIIENDSGKMLTTIEEPVDVWQSKKDVFVEHSFVLPVRKAVATFGVAVGDEIVGLGRATIDAEEVTKTAAGASRLIVSNDVHVLPLQQQPLEPFAFGGTKVVPKADRAFRRDDEVWLFTELRNPAVGSDGQPHVTMKIDVEGAARKIPGTPIPADALPLKGVTGHYGIGSTIDVSGLTPGQYKVRLTVTDTIARQSYPRETTVTIVE
jgi:hypothetical protein